MKHVRFSMTIIGNHFLVVSFTTLTLSLILNSYSYCGFGTRVASISGKEQRIQDAAGSGLAVNKNKQQHRKGRNES
jgi:hypothetical protein